MRPAALLLGILLTGCVSGPSSTATPEVISFTLPRHGGGNYSSLSSRGKLLLVNVFATWCIPCVEEFPLLIQWQKQFRADGLQVIAIALDSNPQIVAEFLRYFEMNFPILLADEAFLQGRSPLGQIQILPTTFVVGRQGEPVGKYAGVLPPEKTEELIQSLLQP